MEKLPEFCYDCKYNKRGKIRGSSEEKSVIVFCEHEKEEVDVWKLRAEYPKVTCAAWWPKVYQQNHPDE